MDPFAATIDGFTPLFKKGSLTTRAYPFQEANMREAWPNGSRSSVVVDHPPREHGKCAVDGTLDGGAVQVMWSSNKLRAR